VGTPVRKPEKIGGLWNPSFTAVQPDKGSARHFHKKPLAPSLGDSAYGLVGSPKFVFRTGGRWWVSLTTERATNS